MLLKNSLYLLGLILIATSCANNENPTNDGGENDSEIVKVESQTQKRPTRSSDAVSEIVEEKIGSTKFAGAWFTVEYPSNFSVSPTSPIEQFDDYSYVDTDEAIFTSPDGMVEFFVYSPQWSGEPKEYLEKKENEKISSEKTKNPKDGDEFGITHKWVTFEDLNGKYERSYHSQTTESTHLVFGVKYSNQKHYQRYKAAYLAFKKSLVQFAD